MKAKQRFSDDIVAQFRENKGLRSRAGTGSHRFIGIWVVVVNDRVFVRIVERQAARLVPDVSREPRGTVRIADREIAVPCLMNAGQACQGRGRSRLLG